MSNMLCQLCQKTAIYCVNCVKKLQYVVTVVTLFLCCVICVNFNNKKSQYMLKHYKTPFKGSLYIFNIIYYNI